MPATTPTQTASAAAILAIRLRSGLTRAQVAAAVPMDRTQLWRIETGRAKPYPHNLKELARVLDVPLSALLEDAS